MKKILWSYLKECWFITYKNPYNNKGEQIIVAFDNNNGGVRFAEKEDSLVFYDWDDISTEVLDAREENDGDDTELTLEEAKEILESWGMIDFENTNIVKMIIGIPGSGKSTFAKNLSGVYVSPDEIRKELYGDISIQGNASEVFSLVEKRIKDALKNGNDVVYDATNTTPYRKSTIKEFRSYGAKKVYGYFINTPFEVCCERNKNRNDRLEPVPDSVMQKMYDGIKKNPPCKNDGFDEFVII